MRSLWSVMLACVLAAVAFAQEGTQPSPEEMQQMMAEYAKLGAPGPEHEKLATLAGEWKSQTKLWMGPDAQPLETPVGKHTGEMILGGRFLRFTQSGSMMGLTVEGIGILGYDKTRQQYTMMWIDNTATAMYTAAGAAAPDGKTITLMGKMDEPATGEKNKDIKYVYRFDSPAKVTFEIWDSLPNGEFFRTMETIYTK